MNRSKSDPEPLSPRPLYRLLADFANSRILDAAIACDFFTAIDRGHHTCEGIAGISGTDPRATRVVLDSLIALALLDKRDGRYYLRPVSAAYLVRGKPGYMGDFRHVALALWDGMAHLEHTLKTGKPLSRLDTSGPLEVWEKIVLGILPIVEPVARALCDRLRIGRDLSGLKVLDIAGGSSIFGLTILERDPGAEITQIDWPNVNAVAKKFARERGLGDKIRFIDGEFRTAPIDDDRYDLVIASNFCRFESPAGNAELYRRAYRALRAGGRLVINDFLPNEERTAPTFPLRFSVYALTHTPAGECYTLSQYSAWLSEAGYGPIEACGDLPGTLDGTTLILAGKGAR